MSAANAAKSVECDDTWPEPDMRLIGDGRVRRQCSRTTRCRQDGEHGLPQRPRHAHVRGITWPLD